MQWYEKVSSKTEFFFNCTVFFYFFMHLLYYLYYMLVKILLDYRFGLVLG